MLKDYIKLKLSMSYFIHSTKRKGVQVTNYINKFYLFYKDNTS